MRLVLALFCVSLTLFSVLCTGFTAQSQLLAILHFKLRSASAIVSMMLWNVLLETLYMITLFKYSASITMGFVFFHTVLLLTLSTKSCVTKVNVSKCRDLILNSYSEKSPSSCFFLQGRCVCCRWGFLKSPETRENFMDVFEACPISSHSSVCMLSSCLF